MPVTLEVATLRTLQDAGFSGGRDSFHAFCTSVFQNDEPRFLRSAANDLVVFRHRDLRAMAIMPEVAAMPPAILFPGFDSKTASENPRLGAAIADVFSNQVFTANPPIHGPIRRILLNHLGPKSAAALEGVARETVRSIVDELPESGEIDFVQHVAEKLTTRFWGALLGMTPDEVEAITICVREMSPLFFVERTLDDVRRMDAASAGYLKLVEGAALRSLSQGDRPLVNAMAAELAQIDLEDDLNYAGVVPRNIGVLLAGNLVDGFHTAALAAANAVYVLLRHPEALAAAMTSPNLLAHAIFEALRLEPPVIYLQRYIASDVVYDGMLIPAGTPVLMLWGAGNFDPTMFPAPEQFDLARSHQGVTTFGGGIHLCPGRFVTVMLVRVLLETFADKGVEAELVDAPSPWTVNNWMNQLSVMPMHIRRRATA